MTAAIDTNILIDFLNGVPDADTELRLYTQRYVSRIVWVEVLVGVVGTTDEAPIRQFLNSFTIVDLDDAIAEEAVQIRH